MAALDLSRSKPFTIVSFAEMSKKLEQAGKYDLPVDMDVRSYDPSHNSNASFVGMGGSTSLQGPGKGSGGVGICGAHGAFDEECGVGYGIQSGSLHGTGAGVGSVRGMGDITEVSQRALRLSSSSFPDIKETRGTVSTTID